MKTRSIPFFAALLGLAVLASGLAWAGDDKPAAPVAEKPAVETQPAVDVKTQPATDAKPETATPSPIHSMMKWVGSQVMKGDDCACPSTEKGAAAWRAWLTGDNVPLAGLRDAMVKDGWNADRTITFFQKMAAKKASDCGDCPSKAGGAPAGDATGAADASESADGTKCKCTGKSKSECGGCDKSECPCPSKTKKEANPKP